MILGGIEVNSLNIKKQNLDTVLHVIKNFFSKNMILACVTQEKTTMLTDY